MPFKGSLKIPIIWFVLFLTLCFVALGGILSGNQGLTTAQAKVIEVTKGIENSDANFSSVYHTLRVQYDYRGERYFESIEGNVDLGEVDPGDMVNVFFDSKYPHAVIKTEVPEVKDSGTTHKVSGWEIFAILVLAVPISVGILFFMMVLHGNGNRSSSRSVSSSRVK